LFIGYRQNFGWEPIVLVVGTGFGANERTLRFELWNRRKYPIAVHHAIVEFNGYELKRYNEIDDKGGWLIYQDDKLYKPETLYLEPNSHHAFALRAPMRYRTDEERKAPLQIEVCFFDPRRARYSKAFGRVDAMIEPVAPS
jgi:hypothetical protein